MQTYIPDKDKMERLQQLADEAGVPLGVFLAGVKDYYDEERQRGLERLRASLRAARESVERGEGIRINSREEMDAFFEDIKRQSELDRQAGKPISDDVKPA